jgi:hypothetical protein
MYLKKIAKPVVRRKNTVVYDISATGDNSIDSFAFCLSPNTMKDCATVSALQQPTPSHIFLQKFIDSN